MNKNGKLYLYQNKNDNKYYKLKNFSTPKNKKLKLKLKNIRFCELPTKLSNKLGHKIIKEALILGLREEYNYNEKSKKTLLKYLTDVNRLKEKVKKNKEDVEENCQKLKQEFYDKFKIIDNYEKQINLLNEEKKEIIKTNNEIISMKNKITESLKKQFNKLQKEVETQMTIIDELKGKILVLEEKKANLDKEFEEILIEEEKKYQKLLEEFSLLSKKYEYYNFEYNKFDKYPEEKIKEDLNLYDNTKTNDLLTEENLKVELAEKNFVRDELINSVKNLNNQIFLFEEKIKEIKEKEKLYGKPLSSLDRKPRKYNRIKKTEMNINIKTNSNFNTKFNTPNNRRTKTISNTKRKRFFG